MSSVPTNATLGFVCQESFTANSTSTCLRYTKLKSCVKHGNENRLNFYCVGENTISIGGSGPVPLPTTFNMTVYNCTMESCPTAAPVKAKSGKKGKGNDATASASTSHAFKNNDKKLTLSGLLILALIVLM
ncbi:hypothetical protein BGZ80_008874 [Entomortierella chlamydospora]|uniref:Uncharacterized protein n=1 Tax=Entomortierella chlamydospora TaxID=101097 RepID=A0A9P6MXR2_9FUNG|nr:hypothetical protein BGZ79_007247 [Entomortierella chlamydospora]KAG0016837.1 hypothetical protein BGZ80_008874 [Entomortierella chlamydospora]